MSTQNSSTTSTGICDYVLQKSVYMAVNQLSLIPAAVIVIVLLFMRKRAKLKKDFLDGRPGIQIPVDFLGDEENRFIYAVAYGGMAIAVTNMFTSSGGNEIVFNVYGHPYIKVFQSIVTVLCLGTIYLPFFMCLSTDAKLLGATLGFPYTVARLIGLTFVRMICPIDYNSIFIYWPIFMDIPALLSHLVLLVRYVVIFVKEVRDKCCRKKFVCSDFLGDECDFEVGNNYVNHVKTLLQGVPKNGHQKWYVEGRNFVYTPEPHFKYSVAILSTVVVAGIIIYELLVAGVGLFLGIFLALKAEIVRNKTYYINVYGQDMHEVLVKFMDILIVTFLVSLFVAAAYMYFQMYRTLVSHRNHVVKLIKGDRSFLPNKVTEPHAMVGMSLRFAGYQVAYFLWGFIIMAFVLQVITLGIAASALFLPQILGDKLGQEVRQIGFAMVPTVLMAMFIFLLQQVLARFVFRDRSINSQVINMDNRRLFLLVSFFFFFFNILVGLFSCMLRILKGMILGVMFIGRVDRPLIMKGFTNLDGAYCAYIGFLHLQVAHKHPVVRVFSHMLWSGMRRKQQQRLRSAVVDVWGKENALTNGLAELKEEQPSRPRVSASALNKWFIAYTMIHNPVLIYNRKGFLKHILMGIPNNPTSSTEDQQLRNSPTPSKQVSKNSSTSNNEVKLLRYNPTLSRQGSKNSSTSNNEVKLLRYNPTLSRQGSKNSSTSSIEDKLLKNSSTLSRQGSKNNSTSSIQDQLLKNVSAQGREDQPLTNSPTEIGRTNSFSQGSQHQVHKIGVHTAANGLENNGATFTEPNEEKQDNVVFV